MSKSKYNGVDPTLVCSRWGSDVVRLFVLFKAPPAGVLDWEEKQVKGQGRFVQRVAAHVKAHETAVVVGRGDKKVAQQLQKDLLALESPTAGSAFLSSLPPHARLLHSQTQIAITGVTVQLTGHLFNVAVALLMKFLNQMDEYSSAAAQAKDSNAHSAAVYHHALKQMTLMLAPLTPHLSSECWVALQRARFGANSVEASSADVHAQSWPEPSTLTASTLSAADAPLQLVVMQGSNRIAQIEVDASIKDDTAKLQEAVLKVSRRFRRSVRVL